MDQGRQLRYPAFGLRALPSGPVWACDVLEGRREGVEAVEAWTALSRTLPGKPAQEPRGLSDGTAVNREQGHNTSAEGGAERGEMGIRKLEVS